MSGEERYAVDRIERDRAVLVADSGDEVSVPLERLPLAVEEGSVLRVPLAAKGGLDWNRASIDRAETQRRLREARDMLRELRRRDPGGDIEL
jgi:hypothetical protein